MNIFKRLIFLPLLIWLLCSAKGYSQSCNVTVQTTDITCAGANDGKATVYVNGQIYSGGNGGVVNNCQPAQTAPVDQASLVAVAQAFSNNSGNISIASNQIINVASDNFFGDLNISGGTLIISGKARFQNINLANNTQFRLVVLSQGELTLSNFNNTLGAIIENYGRVIYNSNCIIDGTLYNHGTLTVNGDLNINPTTGSLYNYNTITVSQTYNNKNLTKNYGTITIQGSIDNNGNGGLQTRFENYCTLTISTNVLVNSSTLLLNNGTVTVGQTLTVSGEYQGDGGSLLTTEDLMVNGEVKGIGATCGSIKVNDNTTINGSGVLSGKIDVCDLKDGINTNTGQVNSPASINCSCGGGSNLVVWKNIDSGIELPSTVNPISGLSKGNYSVTITPENCISQTATFTINEPFAIEATVSVTATELQ